MKSKILCCISAIIGLLSGGAGSALAQGTAFTYQGRLTDGANPANGSYDVQFQVFTTLSGPPALSAAVTNSATAVSNGLFTATLDFGTNIFLGGQRWLEIAVRTNGNSGFNVLAPRQQLTAAPYSIYSENAGVAATVSSNAVVAASIQNGVITAPKLAPGQVVKTLNGLTDNVILSAGANVTLTTNGNSLQVASSGGVTSGWALGGNGGTTSTNFLGTSDNLALELRVNNARALRLVPTSDSPNVIGGASINTVSPGMQGATIGGGGSIATYGAPFPNQIAAYHGTISGGLGNNIRSNAYESTIAGGNQNLIDTNASRGTIGGGILNTIQPSASASTIGGGYANTIQTNAYNSTIGGGSGNIIQQTATSSTVAGGANNVIKAGSASGTIGGGLNNLIQINSTYATVAGGSGNIASDTGAVVGGGNANSAAAFATVAGGQLNGASGLNATVGGGYDNAASLDFATVGGGDANNAEGEFATIAGGFDNLATGTYSTIPGGDNNSAAGSGSFAAGVNAHAAYNGSFIWGDGTQAANSTGANRFEVLATGGISLYTGGNNVNIAPPSALAFGGTRRQMLDLYGLGYGIGVQDFTLYSRSASGFAWYAGGVHNDNQNNAGGGATLMTLDGSGNLYLPGNASVCSLSIRGGCDVAEPFQMSQRELLKGSVVVIDDQNPGRLKLSERPYDSRVAGIVSGAEGINPGISLSQQGVLEGGQNVALSGRVYVLADAGKGAINPGDLLTTSSTPGHAMKAKDRAKAQGAIIGKAMSALPRGRGMVLVLVTLQ